MIKTAKQEKKTDRETEKKTSMCELVGDEWSKREDAMHNQKHGGHNKKHSK